MPLNHWKPVRRVEASETLRACNRKERRLMARALGPCGARPGLWEGAGRGRPIVGATVPVAVLRQVQGRPTTVGGRPYLQV